MRAGFTEASTTRTSHADDIERRPRRSGEDDDDKAHHGGRAHPRRNKPLPPRNPASIPAAAAPPRSIPQLRTAAGSPVQRPAQQPGARPGSAVGSSPPTAGSYTGSYTLTDSPTMHDSPALQNFGQATGTLRPAYGEVPPPVR